MLRQMLAESALLGVGGGSLGLLLAVWGVRTLHAGTLKQTSRSLGGAQHGRLRAAQRTHQMGVRMALGAQHGAVRRLVVRQA